MAPSAESPRGAPLVRAPRVDGHAVVEPDGWELARAEPGADPPERWVAAAVPGTVGEALAAAGEEAGDLDASDWWYRVRLREPAAGEGEEVVLRCDGLATIAEAWIGETQVLSSASMFEPCEADVGALLTGEDELRLCFRALAPVLATPRKPRARWRTRLVGDGNLRWIRTMLLGRAPGFAPGPPVVGPWRAVRLERRRGIVVRELALRPRLDGDAGVLAVRAVIRGVAGGPAPSEVEVVLRGPSGVHARVLPLQAAGDGDIVASGTLAVPDVARWWPHTHGESVLHDVELRADGVRIDAGRVGFRTLAAGPHAAHEPERDGLALHVNGVPVFARGAVWTPVPGEAEMRATIEAARDGGLNLLRIPGTAAYESPAFHDACDELGMLVWQDFMFANLDYPIADDGFRAQVEREARAQLAATCGRPSLAVLCGNSEVEQQVSMLGLDPELGRGELFGELLPALAREAGADAPYLTSAPTGGHLPFAPGHGVVNYFGVGAYLRPIEDARRAGVRFASECLAFANVPDGSGDVLAGAPRDTGADWDFADVRDHYLGELFGADAPAGRGSDPGRYLARSRAVSGEVMAEVFGEWRRAASGCGGGIVLWLRDLAPGAGWGLLDSGGAPKLAFRVLSRVLAPVAVWTTDEGLGGVAIHVANDGPEPLDASLRVALYRDGAVRVEEATIVVHLDPHSVTEHNVEALLGRFVDAAYSYRFGPPGHDAIVVALERGDEVLARSARFPAGRPSPVLSAQDAGLEVAVRGSEVTLRCERLLDGVRIAAEACVASDDGFCLEPGVPRAVSLDGAPARVVVSALNLVGSVVVEG